jgi:hypothetical protein
MAKITLRGDILSLEQTDRFSDWQGIANGKVATAEKVLAKPVPVTHACNHSYLGG